MVTGVECAGLILAVLPLVIEGAKTYSKGVDSIKAIVGSSYWSENVQDFYEEFLLEITILNKITESIVDSLPGLSDDRRQYLVKEFRLTDWKSDNDADMALQALFGSALGTFEILIKKAVRILGGLIGDPTVSAPKAGPGLKLLTTNAPVAKNDEDEMYDRLMAFYKSRSEGTLTSSVKERFHFWRKEEKRTLKLRKFAKCNKKFIVLLNLCTTTPKQASKVVQLPSGWQSSIDRIRIMGQFLYEAISASWECSCHVRHEARVCLKSIDHSIVRTDLADGEFDFLIQMGTDATQQHWQEGSILVRQNKTAIPKGNQALTRMCEAARTIPKTLCLTVLVEDFQGSLRSWLLRPRPRRLGLIYTKPTMTLQEVLLASTILPIRFKRELALTIASSLLGLKEDIWLHQGLGKHNISFFRSANGRLNYGRPFLSTDFMKPGVRILGSEVICHSSPRILELGITLLEIHTGRLIESFRTPDDLSHGQVNMYTDFGVACRVAENLEDCTVDYQDAIQACLDTPWVPRDQEASLSNPDVRAGVYNDVIQKLKNELINCAGHYEHDQNVPGN